MADGTAAYPPFDIYVCPTSVELWYNGADHTVRLAELSTLFTLTYDQSSKTMTISALPDVVYGATYRFAWRSFRASDPSTEIFQDFDVRIDPCRVTSISPPTEPIEPKLTVIGEIDFVKFNNFT